MQKETTKKVSLVTKFIVIFTIFGMVFLVANGIYT